MTEIINTIKDLRTVNFIDGRTGKFRFIAKCKAGYPSCNEVRFDRENEMYCKNPGRLLNAFKRGALLTVEFNPAGTDHWLTVFARVGKKVKFMDEAIMRGLEVGTINSCFDNTNLMDSNQYRAVNSKTWADKAFVMNEVKIEDLDPVIAGVDFSDSLTQLAAL
tara:strand:- start:71 stop:559 length:489 start_codon:yes stop_codon:yes gene_type:complete